MKNTYHVLYNWVKDNYGKAEAGEPSYDLKALACEINSKLRRDLLDKISERLETIIQDRIERNPDKYYLPHEDDGFGGKVYDEVKVREDVIDDCLWTEDSQIVELINKLLWEL